MSSLSELLKELNIIKARETEINKLIENYAHDNTLNIIKEEFTKIKKTNTIIKNIIINEENINSYIDAINEINKNSYGHGPFLHVYIPIKITGPIITIEFNDGQYLTLGANKEETPNELFNLYFYPNNINNKKIKSTSLTSLMRPNNCKGGAYVYDIKYPKSRSSINELNKIYSCINMDKIIKIFDMLNNIRNTIENLMYDDYNNKSNTDEHYNEINKYSDELVYLMERLSTVELYKIKKTTTTQLEIDE